MDTSLLRTVCFVQWKESTFIFNPLYTDTPLIWTLSMAPIVSILTWGLTVLYFIIIYSSFQLIILNYRETRGWIHETGLEHTSYWISVKYMYIASTMQQQPSTHGDLYICKQASIKDHLSKTSPFLSLFSVGRGPVDGAFSHGVTSAILVS